VCVALEGVDAVGERDRPGRRPGRRDVGGLLDAGAEEVEVVDRRLIVDGCVTGAPLESVRLIEKPGPTFATRFPSARAAGAAAA
jgi:hypothetical protein